MCSYIFLHTRGSSEHAPISKKSVFFYLFLNTVRGKRRRAALIQRAERCRKNRKGKRASLTLCLPPVHYSITPQGLTRVLLCTCMCYCAFKIHVCRSTAGWQEEEKAFVKQSVCPKKIRFKSGVTRLG